MCAPHPLSRPGVPLIRMADTPLGPPGLRLPVAAPKLPSVADGTALLLGADRPIPAGAALLWREAKPPAAVLRIGQEARR
jgi:hypothetical protein